MESTCHEPDGTPRSSVARPHRPAHAGGDGEEGATFEPGGQNRQHVRGDCRKLPQRAADEAARESPSRQRAHRQHTLVADYLLGACLMILTTIVELFLGIASGRKALEDVAVPLTTKRPSMAHASSS